MFIDFIPIWGKKSNHLNRQDGYLVLVMIQRGRYNLPADLRLEKLGTMTIT